MRPSRSPLLLPVSCTHDEHMLAQELEAAIQEFLAEESERPKDYLSNYKTHFDSFLSYHHDTLMRVCVIRVTFLGTLEAP